MTKKSIKEKLQRTVKGAEYIGRGDIKRCMGWGNDRVNELVKPLSYLSRGRNRQYDIDEVAARIYEQVEVNEYDKDFF